MEKKHNKILQVILVLLIVLVIFFIAWYINKNIIENKNVPFKYNDTFQIRTTFVMVLEYIGNDSLMPKNLTETISKSYASDTVDCYPILGELSDYLLLENTSCQESITWRYIYYEHEFSNINLGYRIFENDELAYDYYSFLNNTFENAVYSSELAGGRIQNKAIVIPSQVGPALENIELFELRIGEEDNIRYYMISIIKSENTIYTIIESSEKPIRDRKLTYSFTPNVHEIYLERKNVEIIS